jgi:hypothetical protein
MVRIRSIVALARFLKATPVRVVWCEFYDADKQTWFKPRLLLATETDLTAEAVLKLYARRWGINNLWQQTRYLDATPLDGLDAGTVIGVDN